MSAADAESVVAASRIVGVHSSAGDAAAGVATVARAAVCQAAAGVAIVARAVGWAAADALT